jgi:Double zinc ribbon
MQCPKCRQENPRARFCMACGNALVLSCAGCNAELPSAARFGPDRGRPATSSAGPSATVQPSVFSAPNCTVFTR